MKPEIVASVIANSQDELEKRYNKVASHVKRIQLDVMDGKFVKSHGLDFPFILPEKKYDDTYIEAHLMVAEPLPWIHKHVKDVNLVIIHIEILEDISSIISTIKSLNKQVGIALGPYTDVDAVIPYLDELDMVLVFTADRIGYYGAAFNTSALEKITKIRQLKPSIPIEVDGGITAETIAAVINAGATQCVVGSLLQNSENIPQTIKKLHEVIS